MRSKFAMLCAFSLLFTLTIPVYAVDESAADLVARGRLHLSDITDAINKKYKGQRENFWDISSIAYHDFTGVPEVDVVVGLSGYRDKGGIYNDGKQVVEDAGAGFAYFHKEKDDWVLKQVELVKGKKYEGFEGADLMGLAKDQLVVYSSTDNEKIATVFMMPLSHVLKQVSVMEGKDFGPRVAQYQDKSLMVDFRRALIKDEGDDQIYYGHAYLWKNHKFISEDDDFLEAVDQYTKPNLDKASQQKGLSWFENYLNDHPQDFCALANCYELAQQLGLVDKAADYKSKLLKLGMDAELNLKYCDQWLSDKNRTFQQMYLDDLGGKTKVREHRDQEL